jgi:hypothetical protein
MEVLFLPQQTTLGRMLRAHRHGYGWSDDIRAFARMRWLDEGRNFLQIEVCPRDQLVEHTRTDHSAAAEHIVWWERDPKQIKDFWAEIFPHPIVEPTSTTLDLREDNER